MDSNKVLIKPINTEKSGVLKENANKYVFKVNKYANKIDIKKSIESLFKVTVLTVNTQNLKGKTKRVGKFVGKRSDWKKAVVTLKKGETIKQVEES
ncbi:50S ribosomal protein L23 [bacterium]